MAVIAIAAFAGLSFRLMTLKTTSPHIALPAFEPFCSTGDSLCLGFADIPFSVSVDCGQEAPDLVALVDGQPAPEALGGAYPDYVFSGSFAVGMHELVLQVTDSCGQTAAETLSFEVVDCQAPGVGWVFGQSYWYYPVNPPHDVDGDGELDYGAVEVQGEDFAMQIGMDCSPPVTYSIHILTEVMDGTDIPSPDQSSIFVTCLECSYNTIVRIYAWDSVYNPYSLQPDSTLGGPNFVFHDAQLFVYDLFSICICEIYFTNISGTIELDYEGVDSVQVILSGDANSMQLTEQGSFSFNNVAMGQDYTITPYKNDNLKNGVSTFDAILINKHILSVYTIPNPYKLIAADVNKSKTITVQDIILIRKLILNLIDTFPNNTSWRFVPKSYVFPVLTNPWFEDFPEQKVFTDLDGGTTNADFVAIKIGDVNGSANANQ